MGREVLEAIENAVEETSLARLELGFDFVEPLHVG